MTSGRRARSYDLIFINVHPGHIILNHNPGDHVPNFINPDHHDDDDYDDDVVYVAGGEPGIPQHIIDDINDMIDIQQYIAKLDIDDTDDSDDSDDWTDRDSDDSGYDPGYDSMTEAEEEEDEEEDPLEQVLPPDGFWMRWRQVSPPIPVGPPVPASPPAGPPTGPPVCPPTGPSAGPPTGPPTGPPGPSSIQKSPEECVPSTSGLGSTWKRSREESSTEPVSTKRQRTSAEDRPEDSTPSTSGLSSSTNGKFWHGPPAGPPTGPPVGPPTVPPVCPPTGPSAGPPTGPPTGPLGPSSIQKSPEECVPSTSGLGSTWKRSREESSME
ncbi:proline-rich protein HaeIII subfamily 1-like isoform X2 [Notolabrus celidotus]|uniref:proline-rich protein HaeIII subfamily 1-like isoform X2 n=1 Tax=Notolabrus celidotus TaxID=1203425 RepID=UPI001490386F|nr:proline-rich protein HaeIII subfamily 1-like isoform X2 [Notolabrus celidotus]